MNDANIQDSGSRQIYRNIEDIRRIEVIDEGTELVAKAYYGDGSAAQDYLGFWYGWQIVPKGIIWTPLGHSQSSISKPRSDQFTEIHVYKYEQEDENINPANTRGVWLPR